MLEVVVMGSCEILILTSGNSRGEDGGGGSIGDGDCDGCCCSRDGSGSGGDTGSGTDGRCQ